MHGGENGFENQTRSGCTASESQISCVILDKLFKLSFLTLSVHALKEHILISTKENMQLKVLIFTVVFLKRNFLA